jgi:hypothetical protein
MAMGDQPRCFHRREWLLVRPQGELLHRRELGPGLCDITWPYHGHNNDRYYVWVGGCTAERSWEERDKGPAMPCKSAQCALAGWGMHDGGLPTSHCPKKCRRRGFGDLCARHQHLVAMCTQGMSQVPKHAAIPASDHELKHGQGVAAVLRVKR